MQRLRPRRRQGATAGWQRVPLGEGTGPPLPPAVSTGRPAGRIRRLAVLEATVVVRLGAHTVLAMRTPPRWTTDIAPSSAAILFSNRIDPIQLKLRVNS